MMLKTAPVVTRIALSLLLGWVLPAAALEPAVGKVILTISGKVALQNSPNGADFDLAMLEKLPQKTFTTQTPWDKYPVKFTGPLLRDVLAAAKATGSTLNAVAVNDYRTTIPASDTQNFDMVLAHKMNDQPISVRTKGPLFIVYPYDSKPELKDQAYIDRSAWQLRYLVVD
jgi:hypothetical protein